MDVAEWLRDLGLEKYLGTFREHEIDFGALALLTEADLEKIGVALGPRKRLMKAIAQLNAASASAAPAAAGGRRQLTVMFCDLVDSTSLAARLDPEDMVELIRDFQRSVTSATSRYDGHVAKWLGDGALVYFGYPRAHEDDAERAVRAGLELARDIRALRADAEAKLEVRIGVATGLVVVGDIMGEGASREEDVVGETPNLAARLQTIAAPGSVVVAESTRRLLGGAFELTDLGAQEIRGLPAPVRVYAVVRERPDVNRFEAARTATMTAAVGREQEIALLVERWREAREGDGRVVLISGEAGIGKSRVLAGLLERVDSEQSFAMGFQCSQHHSNEAFYPVLGPIWRAAGFISDEPAAQRLDKLEALIERAGLEVAALAPPLAALLSIPAQERYRFGEIAPSEVKERTISALMALFEGLTRDVPVLAHLEDAHWIDPSSLVLFGRFIERLRNLRVLLVVTHRPEFQAPWLGRPNVSALALSRLSRSHSLKLIESLTDGRTLPAEVIEQIVAKTDGVPLFLEELTKTVIESDLLREEQGHWTLRAALTPLAIPSTLQDSLMARLDRLSTVREIAQIGAAIGREFSQSLLEEVVPAPQADLTAALDQLVAAELIYRRGEPPAVTFVFKHALVQDTAYASMLRGRRQSIHADIARALRHRFVDSVESAPAVIAHHFTEAGLREDAAEYWLKATEQALSRSAYVEANRYVEIGLAQLPSLDDGPKRQPLELALRLAHANALLPLRGYDAPQTIGALTQAKGLLDAGFGTDLQRFSVLYGLCAASFFAARVEPAHELASQIVEFAERQDNPTYKLVGHRLLGTTLAFLGRNREALDNLEMAERYRDPTHYRPLSFRFGNDPSLAVLGYKLWALIFLGRLDDAAKVGEQMRAEAHGHGHAPTVAFCMYFSSVLPALAAGDFDSWERQCDEIVAYCEEKKVEQFRLLGHCFMALASVTRAPDRENIAHADASLAASHRLGGHIGDSDFLSRLSEASLTVGDREGAERFMSRCLAFIEASGERFHLANVRRIEGRIALDGGDRVKAERDFVSAIEIARSQEMRIYELRALSDLVRLRRGETESAEMRAQLEEAIANIQGGETTRDVREARALIASLG